jgi:preprotein translocase subunit SecA
VRTVTRCGASSRAGTTAVDEKKKTVGVLEKGIDKVEDYLGIDNLYESSNTPLIGYLNNAIKAKELFHRDKDYVVMNGEVLIVDEHTGRMLAGRRYNDGMHQAIEAKEGVQIQNENQTLATITLQNYFRMYDKLSGMTGTAQTEAAELNGIYKVDVVPIPTNRPMIRIDQPDLVYKSEVAKYDAVVDDIVERHEKGQPVLVGTVSVEKSRVPLRPAASPRGPHEVLNAKHHEREASIVADAGRKGAVTVATNMAGRGTDIMLGGNPEFRAVQDLKARGLDPEETPEDYEAAWDEAYAAAEKAVAAEHDEVKAAGGLYVLGTERHESRRIDNQLRGRSGRQGDPGESRFYLSLQDHLMRLFNAGMVERVMNTAGLARGPADRVQDGLALDPVRADPGRGAELRDPQERPQVRRRPQPPAHRHLRRAPPRVSRARTSRSRCATSSTTSSRAMSTPRPPRAIPRTGTSTGSGPPSRPSTRSRSPRAARGRGRRPSPV